MAQPESSKLVTLLEYYLQHCLAEGQTVRTVATKRCNVSLFIRWCLARGINNSEQVTKTIGEEYKAYLVSYVNPRNKKALEKSTIRKRVTDVRTFFRELHYLEIILDNPLERLRLPKSPRTLPTAFLSYEDIEKIFSETKSHGLKGLRDRAIMECFYACAIRRMELAALELAHFRTARKATIFIKKGKGENDRYVPISERSSSWISAYIKHVRPTLLAGSSGMALFLDNRGLKFRDTQLSDLVKKYILSAGFEVNAACNLFRHSAATHMLEGGADIREIQEYMGHADISTTQKYTHLSNPHLDRKYKETHPSAKYSTSDILDMSAYISN